MRIATLRAPGAPVTSASPIVIMTASTLPALNASIDGVYSNHSKSVATPASLNQPLRMPISNAVQPGQSLYAILSGGLGGVGGVATAVDVAVAVGASFLSHAGKSVANANTTDAKPSLRLEIRSMLATLVERV